MLIGIMRLQHPFPIISQKFTTNLCQRIINWVGSTKTMDAVVTPLKLGQRRSLVAWYVEPSLV